MTTVDGDTVYTYDALDRLTGTVTPDNEEENFTYDAMGNITSSTDKNGNTTQYIYDDSYNLVETIDALGTSAHFEYDAMGNLTKTTLHRVDAQDKVDELEVTVYEYDGRGLTTKKIDALGNVTVYEYDGNGNLAAETDANGYKTEYTYNALDLVTSINYNGVKDVKYVYNAAGDLVQMTDWLGTTTFEVDLLHQLKSVTDHKGNVVTYDYDSVGNQTAIHYPDGTTAAYDYDLVKNQTKATECDGSETTYTYDGMGRVTEMRYPNGWVEYYTYDSMGRLLAVNDTHPSEKPAKTQKHTYRYDANGNMTYEYMRGNGTGQAKNETLYTYDALNRLITAHDNYGNSTRVYTYDSLGNLTYETGAGSHNMDYTYNNLNQLITQSDDGWKTYTASSYDNRGNLVLKEYHKNKKTVNTVGQYFYDETNKMVRGINTAGEESLYSYNGLGALVENTWKIAQNGYGYHGVNADTSDNESHNGQGNGNSSGNSHGNNGNGNVKKTSTVIKQSVPDYTTETYQPLTEHEVNGLDYRYVYSDKARLSVVVQGIENGSASVLDDKGELHAYYHCDYLGTTDYLTSAVNSKVISWTSYNEWGEITHSAVLKCGQRELDLVKLYATHDYDAVLNQFYAKARFYDTDNRRFTAVDPILDPAQYDLKAYANDPMQLVQYLYVKDNAVNYIDPLGLCFFDSKGNWRHDNWESLSERQPNPRNYTLRINSSGNAVKELQRLLVQKGYLSTHQVDGILGPNTQAAVKKFQQDYGLTADGIVGPKTWNAFWNGTSVPKVDSEILNSGAEIRPSVDPQTTPYGYVYTKSEIEKWVNPIKIYVPEIASYSTGPVGYTKGDTLTFKLLSINVWAAIAGAELEGGDIANKNATIKDIGKASLFGGAASAFMSFAQNTVNPLVSITYYQRGNDLKAIVEFGCDNNNLMYNAGGYFLLYRCADYSSLLRVEYQLAKKLEDPELSVLARANVKFLVDSAHSGDPYYAYLYVTPQNTWMYRFKRYPKDNIFVVVKNTPLGSYEQYSKIDISGFFDDGRVGQQYTNKISQKLDSANLALIGNFR